MVCLHGGAYVRPSEDRHWSFVTLMADALGARAAARQARADRAGLPPTVRFCGTRDVLKPGCDALFERADAADWPWEYVVAPGPIHVYPLLRIPGAREAMGQIIEFCAPD